MKECKSSICTMSQLSDQIHYNNQLLDRIRTLENDRKLFGAQLKKMETKCKDDVSKIHTELLESRRKLKIAQDLSDTMSKQSRTYRVDLERSSLLLKQCQGHKEERDKLEKELVSIRDQANKLESSNQEYTSKNQSLQGEVLILTKSKTSIEEKNELLGKQVAGLKKEKDTLLKHVEDLTNTLKETSKSFNLEHDQNINLSKQLKSETMNVDHIKQEKMELACEMEILQTKYNDGLKEKEELMSKVQNLEENIIEMNANLISKQDINRENVQENKALRKQIEELESQLMEIAQEQEAQDGTRPSDQEVKMLQDMIEEVKNNAEEVVKDANDDRLKALAEAMTCEEKLKDKMAAMAELDVSYNSLKSETEFKINRLESTIEDLTHKYETCIREKGILEENERNYGEEISMTTDTYKKELSKRSHEYNEACLAMQSKLEVLNNELVHNRDVVRDLSSQIVYLRSRYVRENENAVQRNNTMKNEMLKLVDLLHQKSKSNRSALDDHSDQRDNLHKDYEEKIDIEKARYESLSQELATSKTHHDNVVADLNFKFVEMKKEIKMLEAAVDEKDGQLQKIYNDADGYKKMAVSLESDLSEAALMNEDLSTHSAQVIDNMQNNINSLTQEKEMYLQIINKLKETITQQDDKIQNISKMLHDQNSKLQAVTDLQQQSRSKETDLENEYNSTVNEYASQLNKSQAYIRSLTQSISELESENAALRQEIQSTGI